MKCFKPAATIILFFFLAFFIASNLSDAQNSQHLNLTEIGVISKDSQLANTFYLDSPTGQRYILYQAPAPTCSTSICPKSPIIFIDFNQYLGKKVLIKGYLEKTDSSSWWPLPTNTSFFVTDFPETAVLVRSGVSFQNGYLQKAYAPYWPYYDLNVYYYSQQLIPIPSPTPTPTPTPPCGYDPYPPCVGIIASPTPAPSFPYYLVRSSLVDLADFIGVCLNLTADEYQIGESNSQKILNISSILKCGQPTPTPTPQSGNKKVLVLNYDPILTSRQNQRLHQYYGWNDPNILDNLYVNDVKNASGGFVQYAIIQKIDINEFPVKADGFRYSEEQYLACVSSGGSACHYPDGVDYQRILADYHVCERRNSGEIDELWLWGGPWFGYWEAVMAGTGAFWTNGPPISGTACQKPLHIMGFNYERGISEMIEDLGHRIEGTMRYVYDQNPQSPNYFAYFTLYDQQSPGNAQCGNVHFAPNSVADYDWGNPRYVQSACDDWYNFPNLTGTKKLINCSPWGCDGYQYKKWWLSHLPKNAGNNNGLWNNWWLYILDYPLIFPPRPPVNITADIFGYRLVAADYGLSNNIDDFNQDEQMNLYDLNDVIFLFGKNIIQ